MTEYTLQITIVRTIGYALGILKGLNANPEAIKEIEDNFDYIVNMFGGKI
jgi:hypothetical protein